MEVKLKTNRGGIIKALMPILAVISFFFVLFVIAYITHYEDMQDQATAGIIIGSLEGACIIGLLLLALVNRKTYFFSSSQVQVYKNKKQIRQFDVDNIINMHYKKFRPRYIVTTFAGELMDGGCWKLYLRLTNGSKIVLDIFETKDVKKLKELYGELVEIV